MRIGTPLGEYPFQFKRLERRDGGVAVIGTVAGLESTVVLAPAEVAKVTAIVLAPAVLAALVARRSRG